MPAYVHLCVNFQVPEFQLPIKVVPKGRPNITQNFTTRKRKAGIAENQENKQENSTNANEIDLRPRRNHRPPHRFGDYETD
jgi:hypothetical protein